MVQQYRQLSLEVAAAKKRTVQQSQDFSLFPPGGGQAYRHRRRRESQLEPPARTRKSPRTWFSTTSRSRSGVSLPEIVDTLYGIDTLPVPVLVSDLHIKRGQLITTAFDVPMTCVAIGKSG